MTRLRLAILLAALLPAAAAAAEAAAAGEVAPGIRLLPGRFVPGQQPDGNTLVWTAPEGLVVVDTGRHVEHTQGIVDLARQSGRPIVAVVNTHWHLDHLGGNALLRKAYPDVRVYASDAFAGALGGFLAGYRKYLEGAVAEAGPEGAANERAELALLDAAPALAPDETVTATGPRRIAGRDFEIHLERHAVTAGDLWLFDRGAGVVVAGDLVTLPVPFLDTACPSRWRAALDRLSEASFGTLVPGHGAPMDRAAFDRYRRAFGGLLDCAASERTKTACADGWLADLGPLLPESEHDFARQLLDYYLDTALRAAPGTRAGLCGD